MLKQVAVTGVAVGLLLLAAPAASYAADPYVTDPRTTVDDPVIEPCEVSTFRFGAGFFLAGEDVAVSVSGLNGESAPISGTVAADDGSLVVSIGVPPGVDGEYAVTFTGAQRSHLGSFTVVNGGNAPGSCSDAVAAPAGTELPLSSGTGIELALTGGSVSPWLIGAGALAVVAGGALVATGVVRRSRV